MVVRVLLRIVYIGKHYAITPAIMLATVTHIVLALSTLGDIMAKVSKYNTILHTMEQHVVDTNAGI